MSLPVDPERLLGQRAWLGALARELVRDAHGAEDLVQSTYVVALERAPRLTDERGLRAWLGAVARNLAWSAARARGRRKERERRSARPEAQPDPTEAMERFALQRELTAAVMALESPSREIVVLRWFEGLPPREIARRLGLSDSAVRTRLSRALSVLRARLDRAHGGDRRAWAGLALGMARRTAPASLVPSPALGVVIMNTKMLAAALAVGSVGLAWVWVARPAAEEAALVTGESAHVAETRFVEPPAAPEPEARDAVSAGGVPEGDALAARAQAPSDAAPSEPLLRRVRGRVVDPMGMPLAGVEVECAGSRASSGPNGEFEIESSAREGRIVAVDARLVTVVVGVVRRAAHVDPLVVVAGHRTLGGRVVDEAGAPLAGASVRLAPPPDFATRFDVRLDASEIGEWLTATDAEGRFELERAPLLEGATLEARLDGFEPGRVPAPPVADGGLVLVLARAGEPAESGEAAELPPLVGRVLGPDGHPAPASFVSLGSSSSATDAAGEFRLARGETEGDVLRAVAPGLLAAELVAPRDPVSGEPSWPPYVELTLGAAPLAIQGRIVDPAGRALPGVQVWIDDPTRFGTIGDDVHAAVEFLTQLPPDAADRGSLDGAYFASTNSGSDGRFRIGGLAEREYTLGLLDPRTLALARHGPLPAGSRDQRIVFDPGPLRPLRGRVVASDGQPVEGVLVSLYGHVFGGISTSGGSATTDEEGRFAFAEVGANDLRLELRGDDVVPRSLELAGPPESEVDVEVAVRGQFKVDLGSRTDLADRLHVLDGEGDPLDLYIIDPNGVTTLQSATLVDGRSVNLGTDIRARTLVLTRQGAEVARSPLHLVPGRLEIVRP